MRWTQNSIHGRIDGLQHGWGLLALFSEKLKKLFASVNLQSNSNSFDQQDFFDDIADNLVEGDIGVRFADTVASCLQKKCKENRLVQKEAVLAALADILVPYAKEIALEDTLDFDSDGSEPKRTHIWMVLGVNGVGKTTTIAKLAHRLKSKSDAQNKALILAACDTFRAGAIEQLSVHAEKIGVRIVKHQAGGDPGAVAFDAADACAASSRGGLVLADTAGRLHNKENLIRELQKIDRICASKASENCYKKILVLDSTTGQNAFRQAETFHEALASAGASGGLDAIIFTKADSSSRGGAVFAIGAELGIPCAYLCFGESYEKIAPFDAAQYTNGFLGLIP
ncbi:MAG: signal recognition particle-docking protein FtsY [Treponemataceae bacterium]|nr:MAG: signal recognition particle-docking protein FtsY [Treponemataceae bacterium]